MKRLIALILMLLCTAALAAEETGMMNPWRETTAGELMQALGVEFGVPEGAEDVVYRMIESESLAEMQFVRMDAKCVARIKPAAEFEDISGFYDGWDSEEGCEIGWCAGRVMRSDAAVVCLWYDIAPGLMYSVGVESGAMESADMIALAGMIYIPTQGEAG